ncbi:MAG: LysR family transcriptional regulator [Pseudomonas sp.]|nr:LysR family transcriptional regulator [Pseudomonas sp.]
MFSSERLKGIDVFVCVADSGSFKAASERMNLTGSAISKSIARLESRLETRLFHRTTRRLSLTDAGTAFYQTCTGVLADLQEAELSLQAENTEPRGRIRIDLSASYGRLHALPVILKFAEEHPMLSPLISFSNRFVDPVEEGIDIVLRVGGPDVWPAALGHRYLGTGRHIFCASPAYLSKRGEPMIEGDLMHHSCVVYGEGDGTIHPWHFPGSRPGEIERRVIPARFMVGDGEGMVTAAVAGCGIAQLPTWLIKRQLEEGTLIEVLPHLATDGLAINLIWIKSRQALPKINALLEVLAAGLTSSGRKTE